MYAIYRAYSWLIQCCAIGLKVANCLTGLNVIVLAIIYYIFLLKTTLSVLLFGSSAYCTTYSSNVFAYSLFME